MILSKLCSFVGPDDIIFLPEDFDKLRESIIDMIINNHVTTFLFRDCNRFNGFAHALVTSLKKINPEIKRVYVPESLNELKSRNEQYLLNNYEEIFMPTALLDIQSTQDNMINYIIMYESHYCILFTNYEKHPECKQDVEFFVNLMDFAKLHNKQVFYLID